MKKILIIAGASLISLGATAAEKSVAMPKGTTIGTTPVRLDAPVMQRYGNTKAVRKTALELNAGQITIRRAQDGTEVVEQLNPLYINPTIGCFYTSMTPDGYAFPFLTEDGTYASFGFGGCNNIMPFENRSTGATSYEWAYSKKTLNDEDMVEYTSNEQDLMVSVSPWTQLSAPILTAFKGNDQLTFENPYVSDFLFAPSLASFGINPTNIFNNFPEDKKDYFGLTSCPVNIFNFGSTVFGEFSINRKPIPAQLSQYSTDGTPMIWVNDLQKFANENGYNAKSTRITKFGAFLPAQNSAYLLDEIWGKFLYRAKADVTLQIDIVPIAEDGAVMFSTPIGKAEITLPSTGTSQDAEIFEFDEFVESVDSEGFAVQAPVTITSAAMIVISGLEDTNLEQFAPVFNASTWLPIDESIDPQDYFSDNTYVLVQSDFVNQKDPTKAIPQNFFMPTFQWGYYNEAKDSLLYPTDLDINYNITFVTPMNDEGGTNQEITVDVAGGNGESVFEIVPNLDLKALIDEGLVTAEANDTWFTWEVTPETISDQQGDYVINHVSVNAQPLPDDLRGRRAAVIFHGMGMYFPVIVTQGEVAGIEGIQSPVNASGIYDLQGRKLSQAPAGGIYIEVVNGKSTKRIAR